MGGGLLLGGQLREDPEMIADHTGEYKSSYMMFAGMVAVSTLMLLFVYRNIGKSPGKGRNKVTAE